VRWYDLVGWAGTAAVLAAYWLSTRVVERRDEWTDHWHWTWRSAGRREVFDWANVTMCVPVALPALARGAWSVERGGHQPRVRRGRRQVAGEGVGAVTSAFSPPAHPGSTSAAASAVMRANVSRDTKPELAVRRALRARGVLGYRVDHRLPLDGVRRSCDVAWPRLRVALFVDGCFWHGCPEHARPARRNGEWWARKLELNAARDRDTDEKLRAIGWVPIRAWEHCDPLAVAAHVDDVLRALRAEGGWRGATAVGG
jgi:DNA mismatch endonuclease, patch repair protein